MLTLSHDELNIQVLPEFGGAIVEAHFGDMQFMFRPPKDAIPPRHLGNEADWVRAWHGGWQPLLPNAGTEYLTGKFPQGFHGNASQVPWNIEQATESFVDLSWSAELLDCNRKIKVSKGEIYVSGTIGNVDAIDREIIVTEHLIFGDDIFKNNIEVEVDQGALFSDFGLDTTGEESRKVAWGDKSIYNWKTITATTPSRFGVFSNVGTSGAKVISGGFNFQLTWDREAFPYAWIWEEMNTTLEEPWDGQYRALGIEPSTCPHGSGLGHKKSTEALKTLAPKEIFTWWVKLKINQEKEVS